MGGTAALRLAVGRREPGGCPEPGITLLDVVVPWPQSRSCDRLRSGDLVAISGLIERDEFRDAAGQRRYEQRILADWIEILT